MVFAPDDIVPNGNLYIIHDGRVSLRGKLLSKGSWWGDDMVLQSTHLRNRHAARCVAYTTCFFVDREMLMALASRYPSTLKRIRRYAIMLALRRELILRARVNLAAHGLVGSCSSAAKKGAHISPGYAGTGGAERRYDAMLWNATHGVESKSVNPLLGPEADRVQQMSQLSSMAKSINEQGENVRQMQGQLEGLAAAVEALSGAFVRAGISSSSGSPTPIAVTSRAPASSDDRIAHTRRLSPDNIATPSDTSTELSADAMADVPAEAPVRVPIALVGTSGAPPNSSSGQGLASSARPVPGQRQRAQRQPGVVSETRASRSPPQVVARI